MARIIRHNVDNDIEKRILMGMVVSDEFCTSVQKMVKKQYFQMDYARIVVGWVLDYYKFYKKAPNKNIKDVFNIEKENLKEIDANLVGRFLSELSSAYEASKSLNYDFLTDQARSYFRERSLTILAEKINGELARGKIDQAEHEVKNFSKVVKDLGLWANPLEKTTINQFFVEDKETLMRFPDELGELVGDLEREWLVAFMGPMKRGKSWMLQELAIHALSAKLRVVFFSLEMSMRVLLKRLYKRITALSDKTKEISWPVFDCERNQDNTCNRKDRTCSIGIKEPGETIGKPSFVKGYKVCTVCSSSKNNLYKQATWKEWDEQKTEFDSKAILKRVKVFERLYGSNLRVKAYPSFTATFDDIISDLDDLWYTEGFAPDVICIDSLDIMAPEGRNNLSERGQIDWTWKRAKGLAGQRHALVASVLQSNRTSITKRSVQQENTSEDIRKLAHVDKMFGLNQTPDEKKKGVMRISNVADRHGEFEQNREVMILQSLGMGQPLLDQQWYVEKNPKKKKKEED